MPTVEGGNKPLPKLVSVAVTFFFVNILWVLFRADTLSQAGNLISCMFNNTDMALTETFKNRLLSIFPKVFNFMLFVLASVMAFVGPTAYTMMKKEKAFALKSITIVVLFVASLLFLNRENTFLYFNF